MYYAEHFKRIIKYMIDH